VVLAQSLEATLRSAVVNTVRSVLIAFVVLGLLNVPLMAASARPLGMVVAAKRATLDSTNASNGADIYSDDALVTDEGGSLRFNAGASQLYLLSLSSASLETHENRIQARIDRGTLGFSTAAPDQLEIQTPLGLIRGADAKPVFGQVSVLSSGKLQITSYEGTLLVLSNGEEKTIAQGEAYEATLLSDSSGGGAGTPINVQGLGVRWDRIIFVGLIAATLALMARFVVWPETSESCDDMSCTQTIVSR
jgi:hypothetical protein